MGSDALDRLDALDDLFAQVQLPALKCPNCESTSLNGGFHFVYTMRYWCPLNIDGSAKILNPDYDQEEIWNWDSIVGQQIMCESCKEPFDTPEGWRIHKEDKINRPGERTPVPEPVALDKVVAEAIQKTKLNQALTKSWTSTEPPMQKKKGSTP